MNLATKKFSYFLQSLRGFSVFLVLMYHLEFDLFSKGYLGVDIFFVISGFLITRIILKEIQSSNNFNFYKFYKRRFLRLYPALLTTLIITTPFVIVIFSNHLVEDYLLSTLFALLSFSNILFWRQSGYFDESSELKPLLHTWSLGVEEQFYFIFPLAIFLSFFWLKNLKIPLVLMGIASLSLSLYFDNSSAAFYLFPFRSYEFLLGSFAYIFSKQLIFLKNIFVSLLASLVILFVIFFNVLGLTSSIESLLVTFSAALLILNIRDSSSAFLSKANPLVFLGDISYSLYLIHWPLIVIFNYFFLELSLLLKINLFFLSLLLAYLQYNFVEQKFRLK